MRHSNLEVSLSEFSDSWYWRKITELLTERRSIATKSLIGIDAKDDIGIAALQAQIQLYDELLHEQFLKNLRLNQAKKDRETHEEEEYGS